MWVHPLGLASGDVGSGVDKHILGIHTAYVMSVRYGILVLLSEGPKHGYQLKQEFEELSGGQWALNVGQVYTTLRRLESGGAVEEIERNGERVIYGLTELGARERDEWFRTPLSAGESSRDELALKVLAAVATGLVNVAEVIRVQRGASMAALQRATLERVTVDEDLAAILHLDRISFQIEAELRWLDHVEERLGREAVE